MNKKTTDINCHNRCTFRYIWYKTNFILVCKSKNMINNKIPTITESEKLQKTAKKFKIQICSETSERWKQ